MEMHPDEFGDIDSVSVNASNGLLDSGCVIDAVTDKKIGRIGGFPKGHPEYMLRARREGLRDYLSQGLDIHYDKNCIGYKEDDEGVTALFKDGSEFRGSILVGADGGMSHVRAQFLQHHHPEPAELVPVVGMLNLATKGEVEELQNIATAVFLMCTDTARMMVGVIDVAADRSHATAYIALCYKPEGVLEEEIKWAATASKEQLFQKAKEQTKDMPSKMQKYVDRVGVEGMVAPSLSFKEFMPPMALPESRVTLIGDSLHSMMVSLVHHSAQFHSSFSTHLNSHFQTSLYFFGLGGSHAWLHLLILSFVAATSRSRCQLFDP